MDDINPNVAMSERQIHLSVMNYIRNHPELKKHSDLFLHIPNESKRTVTYGSLLKRMGMRKGASDLFIALPRKDYHGAWIELKTIKGKPTPAQIDFLEDMDEQGYFTKVVNGFDEAIKVIEWYCN